MGRVLQSQTAPRAGIFMFWAQTDGFVAEKRRFCLLLYGIAGRKIKAEKKEAAL